MNGQSFPFQLSKIVYEHKRFKWFLEIIILSSRVEEIKGAYSRIDIIFDREPFINRLLENETAQEVLRKSPTLLPTEDEERLGVLLEQKKNIESNMKQLEDQCKPIIFGTQTEKVEYGRETKVRMSIGAEHIELLNNVRSLISNYIIIFGPEKEEPKVEIKIVVPKQKKSAKK